MKTTDSDFGTIQTRFQYPRLFPLWIAIFIDIIGFYLILPFVPEFTDIFNTSPFIISMAIASNALFTLIFAPLWGRLSDRLGRKPMLLICQFGTFLGFLILAFSNALWLLFFSRVIDGVFGGNFPIAKAIISDRVPPKHRGIQMTNVGVAYVLASLIGPGIGGILFSFGGIFLPGITASILSIGTMFITYFFLYESWPKEKREKKDQVAEKKESIFGNKSAVYLLCIWGFHTISFTLLIANLSFYFNIILGFPSLEIGILLTISGVFRALMRFTLFKPVHKKIGEINMIKSGLVIFIFLFILYSFVQNVILIIIFSIFLSFSAAAVRGPLQSVITQSVSPKIQGRINSYTTSLDSIALIIGPLIGGLIFDLSIRGLIDVSWWGFTTALLGGIALILFFKKYTSDEVTKYREKLNEIS